MGLRTIEDAIATMNLAKELARANGEDPNSLWKVDSSGIYSAWQKYWPSAKAHYRAFTGLE